MVCLAGTGWEPGEVTAMDWPGAGSRIYLLSSVPTCTARGKEAGAFKKQCLRAVQVWLHPSILEMEPGGAVEAGIAAPWVLAAPHCSLPTMEQQCSWDASPGCELLLKFPLLCLRSEENSLWPAGMQ